MAFSLTITTNQLDKPILQSLTSTGVATAVHPTGYTVKSDDGREFMYACNDSSSVAAVAGAPAGLANTSSDTAYVVTPDVSDGGSVAVGAFLSVLADTYFGWIQTKGILVDAPASGNQTELVAGDPLYCIDANWKYGVVGTNHIKAVANYASASGIGNITLL